MEEIRDGKENLGINSRSEPLTQRRKIALVITFILGFPLSYPTVMPLGILCASILLFQKNKKANLMGVFLLIFQFFSLFVLIGLNQLSSATL